MRTVEVTVTYKYELEIDDNNEIVKEYESENELLITKYQKSRSFLGANQKQTFLMSMIWRGMFMALTTK